MSKIYEGIKQSFQSKKMIFLLIAVMVLPLMYSGLYLISMWAPYDHVSNIPIVYYSADEGTVTESGKKLNIGDTLYEKLKDKNYTITRASSRKDAEHKVNSEKVYMSIVLDKDFSKQLFKYDTKKISTIHYTVNEKKNYVMSIIGSSMISKIKVSLSNDIEEAVIESAFDSVKTTQSTIDTDTSKYEVMKSDYKRLKEGTQQLNEGITTASNRVTAAHKLYEANTINIPITESDITVLGQQLTSLSNGSTQVANGAKEMETTLRSTAQTVQQRYKPFHDAINQVDQYLQGQTTNSIQNQVNTAFNTAIDSVQTQTQTAVQTEVSTSLQNLVADGTLTADQAARVGNELQTSLQGVSQTVDATQATYVTNETSRIMTAFSALSTNFSEVKSADTQIMTYTATFSSQDPSINPVQRLSNGAAQVANGNSKLMSGYTSAEPTLKTSLQQLENTKKEVDTALPQLDSGLQQLSQGATQLSTSIAQAETLFPKLDQKIGDINSELDDVLRNEDIKKEKISSPIKERYTRKAPVESYGAGMMPYFVSLSLWVGGIAIFFVLSNKIKEFFLSKHIIATTVLCMQALISILFVVGYLKIELVHPILFTCITILVALTFGSIIKSLMFLLPNNKVLAEGLGLVLLMLQLTTAGGIYPIETTPAFFRFLHPFLPMTHAIRLMRETMNVITPSVFIHSFIVLGTYYIIFESISLFASYHQMKKYYAQTTLNRETRQKVSDMETTFEHGAVVDDDEQDQALEKAREQFHRKIQDDMLEFQKIREQILHKNKS